MFLTKRFVKNLSLLGLLLTGCETTNPPEKLTMTAPVSSLKANKAMHPQVAQAFLLLKEGKYADASKYINRILQSQPKSAILHILNALTYEKLAEQGDVTGTELAVIGYQNAINLDPYNSFPITQLGKIRYREKQFDQAQEHFANALLLKPNDPTLIHEFAAASYYAYDIKSAVAAIKRAEKLKPEDPLIQRSAAMMYAAVGDFKTAEKHFKLFQTKVGEDPEVAHVADRFNDWQSLYKSGRLTLAAAQSPATSSSSGSAASGSKDSGSKGSGATDSGDATAGGSGSDSTDGLTVDIPPADEGDQATKEEFERGSEAANIVNAPVTPGIVSPDGPKDSKAGGPSEQQIIMDCYILQITEDANTSKGNNIFDALAVTLNPGSYISFKGSMWGNGIQPPQFGNGDTVTYTGDTASRTATAGGTSAGTGSNLGVASLSSTLNSEGSISGRIFAAGISWAGLNYSLNIANAADLRTEIVSRPTLMTFLNKESRFFSGTELVNVSGGNYGSNLNRYQVGVAVTVLPAALVGERITLNIGIESSLLQNPTPNLLQTVDVTKTRVETTARVRLGETIMLGGIYERTEVDIQQGFPGLRDIPLVQYFFSNQSTVSARRSIVILLTPRSPDTVKSAVNRAMTRESIRPHFNELVSRNPDWFHPDANAINIFSFINLDPVLYYEFRTGDILPPSWGFDLPLGDKLAELSSFLYY